MHINLLHCGHIVAVEANETSFVCHRDDDMVVVHQMSKRIERKAKLCIKQKKNRMR